MEYKIEKDLIGEIKDLPIEVVQKMIDCQVLQGNEANITVFQKNNNATKSNGGFDWNKTEEGDTFWNDIVNDKKFDVFFNKYPKKELEGVNEQISNEPHLLYSYEDYKNGKRSPSVNETEEFTERMGRYVGLSLNFNKTKEEEEEYNSLYKEIITDGKNRNFTTLTHEITDLYFELKNIHDDDIRHEKYELIGRKQCEIEIIKEKFKNK